MIDKERAQIALVSLFEEEIRCLVVMRDLLVEEKDILSGSDIAAVEKIAIRKRSVLDQLASFDSHFREIITQSKFTNSSQGVVNCLSWCDPSGRLKKQWSELQKLLAECANLDKVNQAVVETKRRHVERALTILKGGTLGAQVYGKDGGISSGSGNVSGNWGKA